MYPTHPGFLGVGPLIKYNTVLQELSQMVLKGRRQPCKVVPTSLPTFASSLVAGCCRLKDRNCTLSRKKLNPQGLGRKESLAKRLWSLGPFLASPGRDSTKTMPHSPENKRRQTSLPGHQQGGSEEASEAASAPGAGNTHWPRARPQFTERRVCLQNRAPPELMCQQPIQGSSAAQRPEAVTRSLFWSRCQ